MNASQVSRFARPPTPAAGVLQQSVAATQRVPTYPMKDPAQRAKVVRLFRSGLSFRAVAEIMGVTRQAAYLWHRRYRTHGPIGLVPRVPTGAPPRFPASRAGELRTALKNRPDELGIAGERWNRACVAKLLAHLCGLPYTRDGAASLLHRLAIDLSIVNRDLDRRLLREDR